MQVASAAVASWLILLPWTFPILFIGSAAHPWAPTGAGLPGESVPVLAPSTLGPPWVFDYLRVASAWNLFGLGTGSGGHGDYGLTFGTRRHAEYGTTPGIRCWGTTGRGGRSSSGRSGGWDADTLGSLHRAVHGPITTLVLGGTRRRLPVRMAGLNASCWWPDSAPLAAALLQASRSPSPAALSCASVAGV